MNEYNEFSTDKKEEIFFTGEMLFPWMLESYKVLQPFRGAANILAEKSDWPVLYDENNLRNNKVPIVAAVYTNDMYVDREYSMEIADVIANINVWETKSLEHNALRSNGKKVLDSLFARIK